MTDGGKKTNYWEYCTFLILFAVIVWCMYHVDLIGYPPSGNGGPNPAASNVVTDLRYMKAAALMFHADSRDFVPEVPKGSKRAPMFANI